MKFIVAFSILILSITAANAQRKPNAAPQSSDSFKNMLGINAFEWDFLQDPKHPDDVSKIFEPKMDIIRSFSGVRHYLDWEKVEPKKGSFTFNPAMNGSWNYDIIYQRCKQEGIEVLACIKGCPNWLQATYPPNMRDGENIPMPYGAKRDDPDSYIEQAKMAFQFAARYGSNSHIDPKLLSVVSKPRWTNDPVNEVKTGLNTIKYMECDNERDKWWKGDKAHQTADEYAANMSAYYDGDKGKLGPGVGVKTADPRMIVVMAGMAKTDPAYIQQMITWCRVHRGYKPDGSVNLCFDVINYHYYANKSTLSSSDQGTEGEAPELSNAGEIADAYLRIGKTYHLPVWVTETGYDINPGSPQRAISIGNRPVLLTQADWIIRTSFLYARHGINKVFFYELYDDNTKNPTQYASSGLAEPGKRRPAADYILQAKKLLGDFSYRGTISNYPLVDVYRNGNKTIYVLMVPDEKGSTTTATLNLGKAVNATQYQFNPGSNDMVKTPLVTDAKHNLKLTVTETPIFIEKAE
jgi:hypothetical protein